MEIEVIHIDVGDKVFCDMCGKEYTDDNESKGGFLFGSKAVCPECAPDLLKVIKSYKEEDYIMDETREGETFRDFVYRLRDIP
jgi:hypothetical protein